MPSDRAPEQKRPRKPRPLNSKQLEVVNRFLATEPRNAAAAYQAVYKCGQKSAHANASRLLNDDRVRALIEKREDELAKPFRLSHERIRQEMALLSYSDVSHYRQGENGELVLAPGAPPDAMRAVKQVEITKRVIPQANGKPAITEFTTKFRLWDKPSMVRLSSQHRGMIKRSVEPNAMPPGGVPAGNVPAARIEVEIIQSRDGKPVRAKSA